MIKLFSNYILFVALILVPSPLLAQNTETHRSRELGRLLSEARAEVELLQLQIQARRLRAELESVNSSDSRDVSEPLPTTGNNMSGIITDSTTETQKSENKPTDTETLEINNVAHNDNEARVAEGQINRSNISEKKFNGYFETTTMVTEISHSDGWSVVNVPIGLRLGLNLTRNMSLEGMLATSIVPTQSYGGDYSFSYLYSVGVKGSINLNDKTSLFGRLGIGGGEVIVDGGYYQIPYADTDIQLGFGIQRSTNIFSNPNGYFAFDYNQLYNKYGYRIGSFGITFGNYF